MSATDKRVCEQCQWQGTAAEVLVGPNPFDPTDKVTGCPNCKSVDSTFEACDEPECWSISSCGTPTPTGYRRTCGKHRPQQGS